MSDVHTVSVLADHVCVTLNYRTGQTELRPVLPGAAPAGTGRVVRHDGPLSTWGTLELPAVLPGRAHTPLRWRVGALLAVAVTTGVKAAGPRTGRFARLVRLACAGSSLPQATNAQARHAVRGVRWASILVPARWACLEQSSAAALLLAIAGRRAEWRHGIATDPVRLHAWIADRDGRPVEEPGDIVHYTATCTPDGPGPARSPAVEGKTRI